MSRPLDLVVIQPLKPFTCTGCEGSGNLLIMDDAGPLCLACAELDHLVYLPRGDAALTRRAKKASGLSAVVVRFSRSRKRYERQGLLVEAEALASAEEQCLSDADVRARRRVRDEERRAAQDEQLASRIAEEIHRLYPGCPPRRRQEIAQHTAVRGSGRVGRSAAAKAFEPAVIRLAVIASVRHEDTAYDALLMSGVDRATARAKVADDVDAVLDTWSARTR